MLEKELIRDIIDDGVEKLESMGERASFRSVRRKRLIFNLVAMCAMVGFGCADFGFGAFCVLVAYWFTISKMGCVNTYYKKGKNAPDVPFELMMNEDCVMKSGRVTTDKLKYSRREQKSNRRLRVFAGLFCIVSYVCINTNFVTEWEYEKYNGGYMLVEYKQAFDDETTELVVPDTYNGKAVVAVGDKAFYENDTLKKIIIPDTVTEMGSAVFKECDALETVRLSNAMTVMGGACFENCDSLVKIELPDSLKELRGETFLDCGALKEVKLPSGITEIKGNTFENCSSLKSIDIPEGVTRIAAHAFYGCTSLSEMNMSYSVKEIGSSAFRKCSALKEIILPKGVSVSERAFKESPTNISYALFTYEEEQEIWKEIEKADTVDLVVVHEKGTPSDKVTLFKDGNVLLTDYENIGDEYPKLETFQAPDNDLKAYLDEAEKQGAKGVLIYIYSKKGSEILGETFLYPCAPLSIAEAKANIN